MNRINLDAQSSTPPAPEVIEAMRPYLSGNFASAAAAHYSGKQVRKAIERAREQIAAAISDFTPSTHNSATFRGDLQAWLK